MKQQQKKSYKEKRVELQRRIEFHASQANYHRANMRAYQAELEALDRMNPAKYDAITSARRTTNQQQIDRANAEAALDKEQLEQRIKERKAQSMLSALMKNFK